MSKQLITLAILLLLASVSHAYGSGYAPKKYKINLDLPPKERWAELMTDYKVPLQSFRDRLFSELGVNTGYLKWAPLTIALSRDSEFIAEIQAMAELADIGFNELYLINFEYELSAIKACTSVVLRTEDGRIIHGRNLDFPFQSYLARLSVDVVFYKNGNPLYTANVLAGYAGILSGMRHGKFGITLNQRYRASITDNVLRYFFHSSVPSAYLVRKALEKANNFAEAVEIMSNTQIVAPSYFIVSGTEAHEGVIIIRDAKGVNQTIWMQESQPDWFIVHTNDDRVQSDPHWDRRRDYAESRLSAATQKGFSEQTLMDKVLGLNPNLNYGTILTAIFSSQSGYYNTTMWY